MLASIAVYMARPLFNAEIGFDILLAATTMIFT